MERVKKILFCKIHDIWFNEDKFKNSKYGIAILHTNSQIDSEYQFKLVGHTILINIEDSEEEIFKKFEYKSARYPINRAERDGVVVKKVQNEEEKEQYVKFQRDFCAEKGIPMFDVEELNELITYYAISADKEYLGACSFLVDPKKETVRYKYGATKHKYNANDFILWKAICTFHNEGYKWFDMGGVKPTEDKNDDAYRRYQFKKKFGGELVESYSYIKTNGLFKIIGIIAQFFIKTFWKGDTNSFVNWLNKNKLLH